jgi:hypothetical protein
MVNDALGSTHCYGKKPADGSERPRFLKLPGAAQLVGWPTPRAEDSESTGAHRGTPDTLTSAARLSGWPTPTARDHFPPHTPEYIAEKKAQGHGMANLSDVVMLTGWATPTSRDHKDGDCDLTVTPDRCLLGRQVLMSSTAPTGKRGALNPDHSRWLMGFPRAWGSSGVTAMQSCRKLPRGSSKQPKKRAILDLED